MNTHKKMNSSVNIIELENEADAPLTSSERHQQSTSKKFCDRSISVSKRELPLANRHQIQSTKSQFANRGLDSDYSNRLNSSFLSISTFGGKELDRKRKHDDDGAVAVNLLLSQAKSTLAKQPSYSSTSILQNRVLQPTSSRNSDALLSRGRILGHHSDSTTNVDEGCESFYRTAPNQSTSAPAKRFHILNVPTPRFSQKFNAQINSITTKRPRLQLLPARQMSIVSNAQPTAGNIMHTADSHPALNAALPVHESSSPFIYATDSGRIKEEELRPIRNNEMKPCSCTKSQCIKMYCNCFVKNVFCHNCDCTDCRNNFEWLDVRSDAYEFAQTKKPAPIKTKIGPNKKVTKFELKNENKMLKNEIKMLKNEIKMLKQQLKESEERFTQLIRKQEKKRKWLLHEFYLERL